MPYISQQDNRIVFWEELTLENEKNKICIVKDPTNVDPSGLSKFFTRKTKDMRILLIPDLKLLLNQ